MKRNYDKSKFIETLRENPWISFAARKSGISRATIYRWMKENPDFRREVNKALRSGDTQHLEAAQMALFKKIKDGSFPAIKYYLDHNDPKYITKASIYAPSLPIHDHSNGAEICEACIHATAEKEFRRKEIAQMIKEELERLANPKTEKDKEDRERLMHEAESAGKRKRTT